MKSPTKAEIFAEMVRLNRDLIHLNTQLGHAVREVRDCKCTCGYVKSNKNDIFIAQLEEMS